MNIFIFQNETDAFWGLSIIQTILKSFITTPKQVAKPNQTLIKFSTDIFSGFQTLSATIATELPEATQGSTHYRILFLAAVLLFVLTFFINTVAEVVRQRFRRRAHEL